MYNVSNDIYNKLAAATGVATGASVSEECDDLLAKASMVAVALAVQLGARVTDAVSEDITDG